jgi:predicted nucleic-acid-binding Zn-ribbon protein
MFSKRDPGRESGHDREDAGPAQYSLMAKPIVCPHCDGAEFMAGEAQLNTAVATLLNLDWTNRSATILTCSSCGQIQWFAQEPSKVD